MSCKYIELHHNFKFQNKVEVSILMNNYTVIEKVGSTLAKVIIFVFFEIVNV